MFVFFLIRSRLFIGNKTESILLIRALKTRVQSWDTCNWQASLYSSVKEIAKLAFQQLELQYLSLLISFKHVRFWNVSLTRFPYLACAYICFNSIFRINLKNSCQNFNLIHEEAVTNRSLIRNKLLLNGNYILDVCITQEQIHARNSINQCTFMKCANEDFYIRWAFVV